MPFTLHMTFLSEFPVTVATYCDEVPSVTVVAPLNANVTGASPPLPPVGGVGGAASATARLCETLASAALVAVIVTSDVCGSVEGAL
jgi:hypothetical protein